MVFDRSRHIWVNNPKYELYPVRSIVVGDNIPGWAREGDVQASGVPFRTTVGETQIAAVRQALGMTILPCFVRDADPLLMRVPGSRLYMQGTIWLLTHGETRKTKRVRLFNEFVLRKLASHGPLLARLSLSHN